MQGTITYWKDERGFGFIDPDERGIKSIFLHISNCADKKTVLQEGMRVEFESLPNPNTKHPVKAVNVVVLANE
jgi:cold shock CspA family protein